MESPPQSPLLWLPRRNLTVGVPPSPIPPSPLGLRTPLNWSAGAPWSPSGPAWPAPAPWASPAPPDTPLDLPPLLRLPPSLLEAISAQLTPAGVLSLSLTCRPLHHLLLPLYHRRLAVLPHALIPALHSPALTRSLLLSGALPNTTDPHGLTPLDHAARLGLPATISTLLSHRATLPISRGPLYTPLDHAARAGHVPAVSLFIDTLQRRHPSSAVTAATARALVLAVSERREDVARWILAHTGVRSQEAFFRSLGDAAMARLVVEAGGIDVDAWVPGAPVTPLMRACERGREGVVAVLLEARAQVDTVDGCGLTAAHYCVKGEAEGCLELLVDAGAEVEEEGGLGSVWEAAVRKGWARGISVVVRARMHAWDAGRLRARYRDVRERGLEPVRLAFLKAVYSVQGICSLRSLVGRESAEANEALWRGGSELDTDEDS